jgi:hypothetical protein
LRQYEIVDFEDRIRKIYINDKYNGIKRQCLLILKDDMSDATTKAIINHALNFESFIPDDTGKFTSTEDYLIKVLNHRLNTNFKSLSEATEYIKKNHVEENEE